VQAQVPPQTTALPCAGAPPPDRRRSPADARIRRIRPPAAVTGRSRPAALPPGAAPRHRRSPDAGADERKGPAAPPRGALRLPGRGRAPALRKGAAVDTDPPFE